MYVTYELIRKTEFVILLLLRYKSKTFPPLCVCCCCFVFVRDTINWMTKAVFKLTPQWKHNKFTSAMVDAAATAELRYRCFQLQCEAYFSLAPRCSPINECAQYRRCVYRSVHTVTDKFHLTHCIVIYFIFIYMRISNSVFFSASNFNTNYEVGGIVVGRFVSFVWHLDVHKTFYKFYLTVLQM